MSRKLLFATLLSAVSTTVFAYDSDPGYGQRADLSASRSGARTSAPQYYYKPTMRYYGDGYVVTYRFVQWNDKMSRGAAPTYEGARHGVPANAMRVAPGQEPRVTYYRKAATQGTAPTSATVTATRTSAPVLTKSVPAISSTPAKKP